jgi:uncharacterized protein
MMRCQRVLAALMGLSMIVGVAHADGDASLASLRSRAVAGDAAAQVALGRQLFARGDAADKARAVDWFAKAAREGNTAGQWQLGFDEFLGVGTPRDQADGIDMMRRSLADGSVSHMTVFGMILAHTDGPPKQQAEGVTWLKRGAAGGSTHAMMLLATLRMQGQAGLKRDPARALKWFRRAATLGDPVAQALMGQFSISGTMLPADAKAGEAWLRKAARQGMVGAQALLAYYLVTGHDGAPTDPAAGVRWARKASAQHNAQGYYVLGLAFQSGTGEPKDAAQAWYHFAVAKRLDVKHQLSHVDEHLAAVAGQVGDARLSALRARVAAVTVPSS